MPTPKQSLSSLVQTYSRRTQTFGALIDLVMMFRVRHTYGKVLFPSDGVITVPFGRDNRPGNPRENNL